MSREAWQHVGTDHRPELSFEDIRTAVDWFLGGRFLHKLKSLAMSLEPGAALAS
jgi:hypothetical protein